ncbi:MAG: hypothetical protein ACTHJU_04045 [Sphingopyxis sp.]
MGQKADHDLLGQALAFESRYGDLATGVIADKIAQLQAAGEADEADFWTEVADCLTNLHAINGRELSSARSKRIAPENRGKAANGKSPLIADDWRAEQSSN